MSDKDLNKKFEELKSLILGDDREKSDERNKEILAKIAQIEKEITDPEKFAMLIHQSKDEVIDVLGPTVGKLIKRFIRSEIEKINKNIQETSRKIFSFDFFRKRKRGVLAVTDPKLMIKNHLIQLFVVDKESGLILAEFAPQELLDADLVAGMLTAIKSFVEGALNDPNNELESMEYSEYNIQLFELGHYYFATVFSSQMLPEVKSELYDDFLELADKTNYELTDGGIEELQQEKNSQRLSDWFLNKYDLAG